MEETHANPDQAPEHNLPAQPLPLIGRDGEVTWLCDQLRRPDVRLLTLIGPPGIGKTRLGLQVAINLIEDFDAGVRFIALAPINNHDLVAAAIAQSLGIRETKGQLLIESLERHLRDKQILLLLDNFEQVVTAAPLLTNLLTTCPKLKVLVTSRAVLGISFEYVFPVPPLTLPDRAHPAPPECLLHYEAIRLFVARAQALKPNFALTEANAPAVAEICHHLDGLPLAIELAAARIKLFPPRKLLERLGCRLKLLTNGAQDQPGRHQTLRAAIDWSYDLLSAAEKSLFLRLAVFAGGCTLEAVEAICNAEGDLQLDPIDGLTSLVDKSLLGQREVAGGEPRFVMLETIREYALERLAECVGADAIRRQHVVFFLALAEQAEPQLIHSAQDIWLERLEIEHDNLRAALTWSLEQGEAETAMRLISALWRFWSERGHLSEGRRWIEEALARDSGASTAVHAKALVMAGWLAWALCDNKRAKELCEKSLILFQELGEKRGTASSLGVLGLVAQTRGGYKIARRLFEDVLTICREVDDSWYIAEAAFLSATVACTQGSYVVARSLLEESVTLFGSASDRRGIAKALCVLGLVALNEGKYEEANCKYKKSLTRFQKLGNQQYIGVCLVGLAGVAAGKGHLEQAARALGAAEALRDTFGALLPHAHRAYYQRLRDDLEAKMGESVFAAACDQGRGLSIEQVIVEAPPKAASEQAVSAPEAAEVPSSITAPAKSKFPFKLTIREIEVLRCLAEGWKDAKIADELVISIKTVRAHLGSIFRKLGAKTRGEAISLAFKYSLL